MRHGCRVCIGSSVANPGPSIGQLREQQFPIDVEVRHGGNGCLPFPFKNIRAAIANGGLATIDRQEAVGRMNQTSGTPARSYAASFSV
jgi:hypothetical protein